MPKRFVTTEQLMRQLSQDIAAMTEAEKAQVRQALDKAFPSKIGGNMQVNDVRKRRTALTITNCKECGIEKRDQIALYCDACQSMLEAVASRIWFMDAHDDWTNENKRRIEAKRRMMSGDRTEAA
jgi:hypothetical protein